MIFFHKQIALLSFFLLFGCTTSKCINFFPYDTNNRNTSFGQFHINKISDDNFKNNMLISSFVVKNNKRSMGSFQYQVNWFDDKGVPVSQTQPWIPIQLNGNLEKNIKIVSPNSNAKKFTVSFCTLN